MKFGEKRIPNIVVYIMFALTFLYVPLVIAVILSINNFIYDKRLREQGQNIEARLRACTIDCENMLEKAKSDSDRMISDMNRKLALLDKDYTYQVSRFDIDENFTSEEYKNQYALLTIDEKTLVTEDKATSVLNKSLNKKEISSGKKQILRCFNSETTSIISAVTVKNIETMRNKLMKSFETINSLYKNSGIALTKKFLDLKLQMLNVKYAQEYQKEQERLVQKAIREQMVEEEKIRKEIEREKAKLEKEETQFKNEIDKLTLRLRNADDIEKQLYLDKIKELESKLKEVEENKKNVLDRENNTRAGFVYIISNIGSFGENIYKIGMTRRLDPMDRIDELSSASVPFNFDVHAMIFSEDAPALESKLHSIFSDFKVNKVNPRKEFFRVSLEEIKRTVSENFNNTVKWVDIAPAEQYRESIAMGGETVSNNQPEKDAAGNNDIVSEIQNIFKSSIPDCDFKLEEGNDFRRIHVYSSNGQKFGVVKISGEKIQFRKLTDGAPQVYEINSLNDIKNYL